MPLEADDTSVEYTRHDPSGPPNSCCKATVGMMVSERLMVMNHGAEPELSFWQGCVFPGDESLAGVLLKSRIMSRRARVVRFSKPAYVVLLMPWPDDK